MRPGLLPARSVMPAFVFFVMPATERAPPLNEKKVPANGRDFLKFVRSFDFATCVAPLRMTRLSRELSFRSRRGSQREPARLRPAWRCR